ncbi:nuclear transport factor 2 family protein [Parafrankia sp. BMG5.11]|uniref:nuclear transport factor 2 family protein n=1 Tax=Parafrankia sp. BMG5.11 TaxID=222540 RepID=UPI00103EBE80|nr:nuclear transport factor 2 family protein [Parafrankia sp. BMG5.11]TCJ37029.1 nuclear transport factor 2 family protein [Parafrankia sp. BMG5.11]
MTYTLQQLSDLENIRTLKHRYFRAIDTADRDLLETLFTDDVSVDYRGGTYRCRFAGKDEMLLFLANAFPSDALAMHHGHMPEITFTGADTADGIWYLEDVFISLARDDHTFGTAIYRDRYRREDGTWKIAHTEYDRVVEIVYPRDQSAQITAHWLGRTGLKPEERSDISHLIGWEG